MRALTGVRNEGNPAVWVTCVMVLLTTALITAGMAFGPGRLSAPNPKLSGEYAGLQVLEQWAKADTPEPNPVIPKGVKDWSDVVTWMKADRANTHEDIVPDGYEKFHQSITGYGLEDAINIAKLQASGIDCQRVIPKGTVMLNTGWSEKEQKFVVVRNFKLKVDRVQLVAPRGYVAVADRPTLLGKLFGVSAAYADRNIDKKGPLTNCGNPSVIPSTPTKPGDKENPPPSEEETDCPPVVPPKDKPKDPCDVTIPQQPPGGNLATPTPGVVRGEPEKVKEDQDKNKDNPDPVPGGKTGTGTGSTTDPNGNKVVTPAPTTKPDTTDNSQNTSDTGMPN